MQIYLLAVELFALAALLLGFVSFAREGRSERLFPLMLLVIGRLLVLIISLTVFSRNLALATRIIDSLEIFNIFCVVWILIGSAAHLPSRWRELLWMAGAIAVFVTFLPLAPLPLLEKVPPQIYGLIIAVLGAPLIFVVQNQVRWTHLAPPLMLGLANILVLAGLTTVSWLFTLLAYAVLMAAIHWEGLQTYREAIQFFQERQVLADKAIKEATNLGRQRQRLLESREIISNVPNLNQSMEHIVQSMARITHADQSVIFMLDVKAIGLAHLVTVYSPDKPFHITSRDEMVFELDEYPALQQAIESQQQLLLPQQNANGLSQLYGLWHEERVGPTLIQPLAVQGRPVGALMLGNPVTHRPIPESDLDLCQELSPQIAAMLEHRRRYLELELQAEAMAATVQQQFSRATREYAREFEAEPVDEPDQPLAGERELEPDALAPEMGREPVPPPTVPPVSEATPVPARTADEYLTIFESLSEGVILSDTTGRVKLVNKAAERILARPRQDLLGQPIGAIYGQIDSSEPIENLATAFSRRDQPLPTFIENDERALQGHLIPWRNDQREWLGIIAIFKDVTPEVKADQARYEFVAALSRELRGPLTTIKGYTELITQGVLGGYSEEQLRTERLILGSAEQMAEVLDNAVQIITEHRHPSLARFKEVDVTKVINQALREISPLAQTREITLQREIRDELPSIEADRRHLQQILDNLLSNACHFTPKGGRVTLRAWVSSEGKQKLTQSHVILAVADNGVGIPLREIENIFKPFYQLDHEGLGEKSGMGMGLAVVKELVELHNGQVWVESTEGVGSMFQVALPIRQEY
ncbi:MAG: PAS domain-containing protein [Anaerolineae bacterium]|nr:PAS domain-containing protein [Anaerolineae bacterium]